jgi:hypothetical protein
LNKNYKWNIKNRILGLLSFLLFSSCLTFETLAQKKRDHIVLNDSAYIEGYIKLDNSNPFENVFFKKRRKDSYQNYTIQEVSEFYENHRNYQRKTFGYQNQTVTVFLEKLVYDYPEISVFKWLDDRKTFFMETENGIKQLDENFKEELQAKLDNPYLAPLFDITKLNYNSLSYLLSVANSNTQSQTFSRFFRVTPQIGFVSSAHHFKIPNQNEFIKLKGSGSSFGFNLEIFPTLKRNVSLNFSPSFISGSAFSFSSYQEGSFNLETDLFFDYTSIQMPVQARYYLEIEPNEFRGFFELGYGLEIMNTKNGVLEIAEFRPENISTDTQTFELSSNFRGINTGMGIEKYLKKTKAVTLGITYSSRQNAVNEKSSYLKPYLGFKF